MSEQQHSGRGRRPHYRALSPLREHLRESFWFAPLVACVGAVVLAGLTDLVDQEIFAEATAEQTADTLLSFASGRTDYSVEGRMKALRVGVEALERAGRA
ncbi:hypothetical protein ACIQF6_19855 [Kitasatospora sp. NPDC092948]|uniref:hypothetical protein n=1 Tax=Kitasatospora sp. NPDC092948 TaxID=3364088 RepID=UPI0038128CAC